MENQEGMYLSVELLLKYEILYKGLIRIMLKSKKKIFIENSTDGEILRMENMCEANECFWFTSYNYNALFKMRKSEYEAQYVCSFPNEESKKRMYSSIFSYGSKIYCIPLSANSIGIYDYEKEEAVSIEIRKPNSFGNIIYNKDSKFFTGYLDNNYLYMFPHTYPAVVRLNIESFEVEYFDAEMKKIDAYKKQNGFYIAHIAVLNGKQWVISNASDKLYQFDSNNMEFHECAWVKLDGISVLGSDKNKYLWIYTSKDNSFLKVDVNNHGCEVIKNLPKGFEAGSFPITRCVYFNKYMYFVPGTANYPIKIDIDTNRIEIATEILPYIVKSDSGREVWKYCLLKPFGDKLFAYDCTGNQLIRYCADDKNERRGEISFKYSLRAFLDMEINNKHYII